MKRMLRWVCPQCNQGCLAPSRPRRNDIRRYCLDCSKKTGKLVDRVSPRLETQRKAAKERARAKAKASYVFKASPGYYELYCGANGSMLDAYEKCYRWGSWSHAELKDCLRVRDTKGACPATVKGEHVVIHRWPGQTWSEAQAQIAMAVIRAQTALNTPAQREWARSKIDHWLHVRPLLNTPNKAEEEIVALLTAKAAVNRLGDDDNEEAAGPPF